MRLSPFIRVIVIAVFGFGGALGAIQQSGRPLAIEDYYRIKTVGSVQISPDADWVSFAVSTRVEDDPSAKRENQTNTEAYVVPSDGSADPRRVQHEGRDVSNPRWTDDNFLQYSVGTQTFKVRPSGEGAPIPVESARDATGGAGARGAPAGRGAGNPIPSPDGRWVMEPREKERLKTAATYVSDFEKRHQERFKGAVFDWKDFQRDGAPFPAPDPTAANAIQITVRPAAGGESKVLVEDDLRPSNFAWHPDGKTLAFTADADWRNELKYASPDLWTVTIDGKVTQLTNDGYSYSDVGYSPDGKYLSYARTFGTDMVIQQKLNHGGPRDLFIQPVAGGTPINLTATWDLEPGDSRWSPDSKYLYFTAGIGGETHLFRVSVVQPFRAASSSGVVQPFRAASSSAVVQPVRVVVEQVTKGPRRINGITYDKGMTKIAYTVGLHEAPPDVYVANIDGTGERRLSNVHGDFVKEIAFSRAERLRWRSNDGTEIEGWLMFPYGYPSTRSAPSGRAPLYPMIVTSHGGPHSATGYSFDFKDQYFAANGYFVLDTNFRSSTGYGEAFKWATWGAWGDKDGQDVVSGIDYVLKRYPVDPARVGHTGHSYGGFMTNWLITQYPDRFAAAIAGAGISNWISDYGTADIYRTKETEFFGTPWEKDARDRMIRQSPLTYAGRVKTPTLFVHGEVDQRVPYEEAEQMYFALKRRGVPAKMIRYAGQPHGIGGHTNNVHRMLNELAWFDKYVKAAPATKTSAASRR
jgi:dipeptidyl aminopeptidase/acylaminoacyl peptidase